MQDQHEHLIIKSLSGSLTSAEEDELRVWLEQNTENRREYEEYQQIWKRSNPLSEIPDFQSQEEWEKLKATIAQEAQTQPPSKSVSFRRKAWLPIAASVTFLVVCATILYLLGFIGGGNVIVMESGEQEINFNLPDGSQVWLNRNSRLSYQEDFSEAERTVSLIGEAFFEVVPNPDRPFVVQADKAEVEVLGTSFNVKAFKEAVQTQVYVLSGKVSFRLPDAQDLPGVQEVILNPGETGILHKIDTSLSMVKEENPNILAWKDKQLIFKKASLQQAVKTLEEYFAVKVSIANPALLDCRFTSSFSGPELEEVLEVLRLTFDLTIVNDGDSILIEGEGCK